MTHIRRHEIDDEIVEELHDHLEREIQMHLAHGVPRPTRLGAGPFATWAD